MTVWLVLALADETGGWIIHGVFSTRRRALGYAATVPHAVYVSPREMDRMESWRDPHVPWKAVQLTRDELLAEGLDFSFEEAVA